MGLKGKQKGRTEVSIEHQWRVWEAESGKKCWPRLTGLKGRNPKMGKHWRREGKEKMGNQYLKPEPFFEQTPEINPANKSLFAGLIQQITCYLPD